MLLQYVNNNDFSWSTEKLVFVELAEIVPEAAFSNIFIGVNLYPTASNPNFTFLIFELPWTTSTSTFAKKGELDPVHLAFPPNVPKTPSVTPVS